MKVISVKGAGYYLCVAGLAVTVTILHDLVNSQGQKGTQGL